MKRLVSCTISKGELTVPGLSTEEYRELGNILREKIYSYEINMWKPIAISCAEENGSADTVLSKIRGTRESYVELFSTLGDVVFGHLVKSTSDSIPVLSIGDSKFKEDELTCLIVLASQTVTSSDSMISVMGEGVENKPVALIKDIPLLTIKGDEQVTMKLLCARTRGVVGFSDTRSFCNKYQFVPLGQVFDLTKYVTVHRYKEGDQCLRLMYKRKLDEAVLQELLRRSGRDYEN